LSLQPARLFGSAEFLVKVVVVGAKSYGSPTPAIDVQRQGKICDDVTGIAHMCLAKHATRIANRRQTEVVSEYALVPDVDRIVRHVARRLLTITGVMGRAVAIFIKKHGIVPCRYLCQDAVQSWLQPGLTRRTINRVIPSPLAARHMTVAP